MKALPLILAASLGLCAFTFEKVKIEPKFEKGQKTKWKTDLKIKVGENQADLFGNIIVTTDETGDTVKMTYDWENPKATLDGNDLDLPFNATKVTLNKAGEVQDISGGIEGSDVVRTFLAAFAHFPKDELEKDGKWAATYPKIEKIDLGERKVEGTYLGSEEVSGKKAEKFKTSMKEGEFSVTMTYWTQPDGKLLKIESSFTQMPVPATGSNGDGTFTAVLTE